MKNLKRLSIRSKITLVILGVAGAALLLFSLIMLLYTAYSMIVAKISDYKTDAAILAKTITAAVAFDDQKAASDILSALSARPDISGAAVYDRYLYFIASYTGTSRCWCIIGCATRLCRTGSRYRRSATSKG